MFIENQTKFKNSLQNPFKVCKMLTFICFSQFSYFACQVLYSIYRYAYSVALDWCGLKKYIK